MGHYVARRLVAMRYRNTDVDHESLGDYMYHNTALTPSGEYALNLILGPGVSAYSPLIYRIPFLPSDTLVTFIYGQKDWMDITGAEALRAHYPEKKYVIDIVPNCGHQLMLENPSGFTSFFLKAIFRSEEVSPIL